MPARILPPTPENIALAANAILRGEVVGMPTETVYGLAGLALDEASLARIFSTKDRPTFDPLIVHVALPMNATPPKDFDWIEFLASLRLISTVGLSPEAKHQANILAELWPGPLTLVLPKQPTVPDLATAGLSTVAIRVPAHDVAQELLHTVGQPLAAPSANRFGRISPTSAADVQAELGDRISLILDGGPCRIGLESTVVSVRESGEVTLLRPGGISREALEGRLQGRVLEPLPEASTDSRLAQVSPGRLMSHYAPKKPLKVMPVPVKELSAEQLLSMWRELAGYRNIAVILYQEFWPETEVQLQAFTEFAISATAVRELSHAGDSYEAARTLFRTLREIDADPAAELILAEPPPDEIGLNHAIADRLRRASHGKLSH